MPSGLPFTEATTPTNSTQTNAIGFPSNKFRRRAQAETIELFNWLAADLLSE
jgi:hypothetical protein